MSHSRFTLSSPAVIHETVDGQTIIVNLDSGSYYDLNATGSDVWTMLVERETTQTVASRLAARYDLEAEQAAAAVHGLVEQLRAEQIVVPAPDGEVPAPLAAADGNGTAATPAAFEPPVLRKHTDMQDLLLLDPVHEVDENGWPNRR